MRFARQLSRTGLLALTFVISSLSLYSQQKFNWSSQIQRSDKSITFQIVEVKTDIEGYDGDSVLIESTSKNFSSSETVYSLTKIDDQKRFADIIVNMDRSNNNLLVKITGNGMQQVKIKVPNKLLLLVNCLAECLSDTLKISRTTKLNSVTGSVKNIFLSKVTFSSLDVNTRSEKIVISNIENANSVNDVVGIQTSGSIDISFPISLNLDVFANSKDGGVYSDLDLKKNDSNILNPAENVFQGSLNKGGKKVFLRTVYGNILIRKEI